MRTPGNVFQAEGTATAKPEIGVPRAYGKNAQGTSEAAPPEQGEGDERQEPRTER